MNKRTIILIVGVILVAVLGALLIYSLIPDRYNWYPRFRHEGVEPYDLSLFRETLEKSYEESYAEFGNFESDSNIQVSEDHLLVYIAGNDYLDSLESAELLNLVEKGATIFISSRIQNNLVEQVLEDCFYEDFDDIEVEKPELIKSKKAKRIVPTLSFSDLETWPRINRMLKDDEVRYEWAYFDLEYCYPEGIEQIGDFTSIGETYTNFIRTEIGAGEIYLHTNPMIFTNYHFRNELVYDYVNSILEECDKAELVYYNPVSTRNRYGGGSGTLPESPLKFILNNPPLKWAMYLLLALTLIFVINFIRRSQRSIPVKHLPENETANYLDVVSKLYLKDGKHMHIIRVQEKMLLNHLNQKYGLPAPSRDEFFFENASRQLEMEEDELKQFFKEIERAKNNSTLTDADLFKINSRIQRFYSECP